MESRTIKELWRVESSRNSKPYKSKNILYGYSGNPMIAYQDGTTPELCIFATVNTQGTETGWLICNDIVEGKPISEHLREFIEGSEGKKRLFYRGDKKRLYAARTGDQMELIDYLYALRYGFAVDEAKQHGVTMVATQAAMNIRGVKVFNLMWDNMVSKKKSDPVSMMGEKWVEIYHDENTIYVHAAGEVICKTQYEPDFYWLLCKLKSYGTWEVYANALKMDFLLSGGGGKKITIPFAEIVGTYYDGKIDLENPLQSVLNDHKTLREKDLVYDHLTHNEQNNFPWALALIPRKLNSALLGRDKIKPPYYFFTVYHCDMQKYKIKFGYFDKWECRYYLDDLAHKTPNGDYIYATMLKDFKKKIGKNALTDDTAPESCISYLSYYADTQREADANNMLTAMLEEPLESYENAVESYTSEVFKDMPLIY